MEIFLISCLEPPIFPVRYFGVTGLSRCSCTERTTTNSRLTFLRSTRPTRWIRPGTPPDTWTTWSPGTGRTSSRRPGTSWKLWRTALTSTEDTPDRELYFSKRSPNHNETLLQPDGGDDDGYELDEHHGDGGHSLHRGQRGLHRHRGVRPPSYCDRMCCFCRDMNSA